MQLGFPPMQQEGIVLVKQTIFHSGTGKGDQMHFEAIEPTHTHLAARGDTVKHLVLVDAMTPSRGGELEWDSYASLPVRD